MRREILLVFLLFVFFSCEFASNLYGQTEEGGQDLKQVELDNLRKELKIKKEKIEKLKKEEISVFTEVENLEEEIELTEKLILRLRKQAKGIQKDIATSGEHLENIQEELKRKREIFVQRLREIYKHNRLNENQLLVGATPILNFFKGYKFLQIVSREDQKLIHRIETSQRKTQEEKKSLELKKQKMLALGKEKKQQEKEIQKERKKKKKLLKKIKSEKELFAQAVSELEKSAEKIQKFLHELEEKRKKDLGKEQSGGIFATLKGRLPWPVKGRVLSGFGEKRNPQFNTYTFNPGIDIQAVGKGEVEAVAPGKVIYSSWLRGYGNFLILQHDFGYYTLYARLSQILVSEGEEVEKSQVIGVAEIVESNPVLHFEIRKGKKQEDPIQWLK